jgi:hypothetical protein
VSGDGDEEEQDEVYDGAQTRAGTKEGMSIRRGLSQAGYEI